MISGIDLNATVDYQIKKDTENPTIWKIGIIPTLVFMNLVQNTTEDRVKASYEILQLALRGWENFNIPYETVEEELYGRKASVVPLSIIESIPIESLFELAEKAIEVNSITVPERKN